MQLKRVGVPVRVDTQLLLLLPYVVALLDNQYHQKMNVDVDTPLLWVKKIDDQIKEGERLASIYSKLMKGMPHLKQGYDDVLQIIEKLKAKRKSILTTLNN